MANIETAKTAMLARNQQLRKIVSSERPDLLDLYATYFNEALAARKFLESNISALKADDCILEIGGGILALSLQLASEGFNVTSVEPIGEGFEDIQYLMFIHQEHAKEKNISLKVAKVGIEEFEFNSKFQFMFSINVMEHIINPFSVAQHLSMYLEPNGEYRFFCPNYDFPYEPHFSRWIFSRKDNAFFLKKNKAASSEVGLTNWIGLYNSINYITTKKMRRSLENSDCQVRVNKLAFFNLVNRSLTDEGLFQRHPRLVSLTKLLVKFGMLKFTTIVPVNFQPVMDFTIKRAAIKN
jgi:2-polyprenyl-3-methyl-5-hydroxy-6-metoxy-1,4-benzoquinol methylase